MKYKLPKLPYPYNALEPYIDEKTVRIHHDKHHASYVKNLNEAIIKLNNIREIGDYSLIKFWTNKLSFNGSGNLLHTIYWENMNPKGKKKPGKEFLYRIEKDFGEFSYFKKQFISTAQRVEASGWAILLYSKGLRSLEIIQIEKHQNLDIIDGYPLLVCDVWEHAYYLKYQNRRLEYIKNWWNLIDWDNVESRYFEAVS